MWNFIGIVTRHDYHDYIDQIWDESEDVSKSCKVSVAIIHFANIVKVSERLIISYISKSEYINFSTLTISVYLW